nr:MAG TPA: hypothetical protein [Caudoviricetes sp.]
MRYCNFEWVHDCTRLSPRKQLCTHFYFVQKGGATERGKSS